MQTKKLPLNLVSLLSHKLLLFSLIAITAILVGGFSALEEQQAYAIDTTISDQASCESIGGTWSTPPDTCTITTDQTIADGDWTIPSGVTLTINSGVTVIVDDDGVLINFGIINNDGILENFVGIINNSGTINNSDFIINDSSINNTNSGIINNSGRIDNVNGDIDNSGLINNDGTFNNLDGDIKNNSGGIINNSGTFNNAFTINNNSGGIINNSGTLINDDGRINNNSGGTFNNLFGGIINNSNNFGGIINNNIDGTFNNNGGIINNNIDGTFNNNGTINNSCVGILTGTIPDTGNAVVQESPCVPEIVHDAHVTVTGNHSIQKDLRVDGKIGIEIDITNPNTKLHVKGTGTVLSYFQSGDNGAVQLRLQTDSDNRRIVALDDSGTVQSQMHLRDNGEIRFYGQTVDDARGMAFDSIGNVGIGTTAPASKLQIVDGYIQLDTSTGMPPDVDCNEPSEVGRMKVDDTSANLYVCTLPGWITLSP